MTTRPLISPESTPSLPRGVRLQHDRVRDRVVLLAPERVLVPDVTSIAILEALDGATAVREIARVLAERFDAAPREIERDAVALLQHLADDGFVRS